MINCKNLIVLVAALLIGYFACTPTEHARFVSTNPAGNRTLVLDLPRPGVMPGEPHNLLIGEAHGFMLKTGGPLFRWQLTGRRITSIWPGWSAKGDHFSLLVCDVESCSLERLSFASIGMGGGAAFPDYADSDARLFSTLRVAFGDQLKMREATSNQQIIEWFCNGEGAAAFRKNYVSRPMNEGSLGKVIRIP